LNIFTPFYFLMGLHLPFIKFYFLGGETIEHVFIKVLNLSYHNHTRSGTIPTEGPWRVNWQTTGCAPPLVERTSVSSRSFCPHISWPSTRCSGFKMVPFVTWRWHVCMSKTRSLRIFCIIYFIAFIILQGANARICFILYTLLSQLFSHLGECIHILANFSDSLNLLADFILSTSVVTDE
jgi:hypothetical protein